MTIDLQELFPDVKGLDQKSTFALLKALKRNFDVTNFDFLNFKKSVQALSDMNMDEATSYKSAFATAATMGLTKEKLLRSAKTYFEVLDRERENFATALLSQQSEKIDGRKTEASDLTKKIEAHKVKIKELEREIEIFQGRINSVDQDVEAAAAKINGTKEKFLNVYSVLSKSIGEDIDSIQKHI